MKTPNRKESLIRICSGQEFVEDHGTGPARTGVVIGITLVVMVAEIIGGTVFGSMALLVDGWHMGSHAAALSITLFAYWYAGRHRDDPAFAFGTGKVGVLAGFTSALALAATAVVLGVESIARLFNPTEIQFDQAIIVAVVGLVVNLVCARLLHQSHHGEHSHGTTAPSGAAPVEDQNLKAAYLHVAADALTSVGAIVALVAGRYLGFGFLDPVIGMVGSLVILKWAVGLLRDTGAGLLDRQPDPGLAAVLRGRLEETGVRVRDLHIWNLSPGRLAAVVSVEGVDAVAGGDFRNICMAAAPFAHLTVEVGGRVDPSFVQPAGKVSVQ